MPVTVSRGLNALTQSYPISIPTSKLSNGGISLAICWRCVNFLALSAVGMWSMLMGIDSLV